MRVKNVSGNTKVYVGQTLENNQTYDLSINEIYNWQINDLVFTDLNSGALLIGDQNEYKPEGSQAINFLLNIDTSPKDPSGRSIIRNASTNNGWHYQLFSVEITTSKYNGYYSTDDNGSDPGFITHKIYKSDGTEITSQDDEALAIKTVFWFRPTFDYEIIGAIFGQSQPPITNVRLFATGLPGVADIKFSRGGINLKHAGSGTYQMVDGRSSKQLNYIPQLPDANSFKFTTFHDEGLMHSFQISFEIFKSP